MLHIMIKIKLSSYLSENFDTLVLLFLIIFDPLIPLLSDNVVSVLLSSDTMQGLVNSEKKGFLHYLLLTKYNTESTKSYNCLG